MLSYLCYVQWQLPRDLEIAINFPEKRIDDLTWVRLKWLAQREDIPLKELLQNIKQYPEDVGPLTRKNIHQFLEQLATLKADIADEKIDKIVNGLFEKLDRMRSPYRNKELAAIENQPDIPNLGLAQDVLYSALDRGEQIQVTANYGIDEYCSAYIISQTLKEYLNRNVHVQYLPKDSSDVNSTQLRNKNVVNILIGDFGELGGKDTETRSILIGTTLSKQTDVIQLGSGEVRSIIALKLCQRLLSRFETPNMADMVIYDLETTGINIKQANIVEIAAKRLNALGNEVKKFDRLVKPPGGNIPRAATKVHGIRSEDVEDAPSIETVLPEFYNFIQDSILVGHNAAEYDNPILKRNIQDYLKQDLTNLYYDTLVTARKLLPRQRPHLPPFLYAVCVGVCVYRNKLESLMGYGRIPPYKPMSVKNRQGGILMKYTLSWVHPRKIITGFRKVFNGICIKKPTLRNFYLMLQAVCVAPSFRIQSIASHLPIRVKHDKSKQKRVLRFIDTYFPVAAVKGAWLSHIVVSVCRSVGMQHLLVLIDETDLPGGWKAIVAALPFRNRAIPLYWVLYKNEMLKDGTYQGHNDLVQQFCCDVHSRVVKVLGDSREPVLVFDRGFARARAILKFFEGQGICYLMRVPRNVGVRIAGNKQCLEEVANGFYPQVLYHYTEQVPVALYVGGQHTKKDPLYLISNRLQGNPLRTCYKRRTQIEHGFRDLKTNFGFKALVLRKNEQPRMEVLFLLAVVAYGLAFLCYEKAADRWAKTLHPTRKVYSVISVINRMIREVWTQEALLLFTERTCLRDINFLTAEELT